MRHLCDENTGERTARKFGGGHFPTTIDWFFTFSLDGPLNYESAALRLFIYQRKEAFK